MKENGKRGIVIGTALLLAFVLWTVLVLCVDVRPVGQNGTDIGFSALNIWFHSLTGVHMGIYHVTDWLGLVPIAVCLCFVVFGLVQLIRRRSLKKVDPDILLLGAYFLLVILGYLIFELIPINYRPVLIDGALEASYPSSTTLLVLCVMPALQLQIGRRAQNTAVKRVTAVVIVLFSAFMVIGRLVSGVHWLTDIIGAVFLSAGLFLLYRAAVALTDRRSGNGEDA